MGENKQDISMKAWVHLCRLEALCSCYQPFDLATDLSPGAFLRVSVITCLVLQLQLLLPHTRMWLCLGNHQTSSEILKVLWLLVSHCGECCRESPFEPYESLTQPHLKNINKSLKSVNSMTCPSLAVPYICASPLSVHQFPILFSWRWLRLKVYCGWLFRKVPLSKSGSN